MQTAPKNSKGHNSIKLQGRFSVEFDDLKIVYQRTFLKNP